MEVVNKIIHGVHSDNDPNHQPEHTMRYSMNGVIMDAGEGNYVWEMIKGTLLSFSLSTNSRILGWCNLRERHILLVLDDVTDAVYIMEVTFNIASIGTTETLWVGSNAEMNLSMDYPIRAMYGFYESQEIQRLYWTDDNNDPRVLNIGYEDPLNKTVIIDEKFLPFSPKITGAYGEFKIGGVIDGGYLQAGSYFFCWRYINEDYYSDWSYLSNPVNVGDGNIGYTPDEYQAFQGAAPDEVTSKAIQFNINGLDTDYSSIQVAAFYSNDYNSAEPGNIFYDGNLTGTDMQLVYYGNENAGTVTIEEILDVSIVIKKAKDMVTIDLKNVIGNIQTREELDVSGLNIQSKNNQIDCDMELTEREVILDITGYPYCDLTGLAPGWTFGNKGLFQSPVGFPASLFSTNMYCGIQYQGTAAGGANLDGGGAITWVEDEIFTLPVSEIIGAILTSGSCQPVVALKKYRKSSAGPSPAWDDYEWAVHSLDGEFLDYKSSVISNTMRSLPGGETIRYGLCALDLTGRPFFVRWLNNQDVTLGTGDPTIPDRTNTLTQNGNALLNPYDYQSNAEGYYYNQLNGVALGMKISNLDITDIIDDISAFMIVRAPIVHQYIASGILALTYATGGGNDIKMSSGFIGIGGDTQQHPGTYAFICPEDVYNLKDFSIQPGDKIKNLQWVRAYLESEAVTSGYGRASMWGSAGGGFTHNDWYQKMLNQSTTFSPGGSNSEGGVEHDVLYATKYQVGDNEIAFDPRNEVLLYQATTAEYEGQTEDGKCGRHNILVLDIDESGSNPKGVYNNSVPTALICSVKREQPNPYGGTSDSSLANTNYLACGHFQEINDTVKADIVSGGRYIFHEIEVFGGDHYISLHAEQRVIVDRDGGEDEWGHGIIFPVSSRVNIGLREGKNFAKDRPFHETYNTSGIRMEVGDNQFEEYNYNDGYSSDDINDYYLPVPFNATLINDFDVQIRHSPQKSVGERQDQFRIFNTNDQIDLDSMYGELINIRNKFNRIVFWQRDAVGYVPVNERALTQTAFGDPVQLGAGGIFERHDEMTNKVGNSNQFGLVESDMGFHWYDAKRKIYLSLTEAMKFSQDSIAKGLNNWLEENVDTAIVDYDNPIKVSGTGIAGGYDPYHKVVFTTFFNPTSGGYKTIGYDVRLQKYIGEFTIDASRWMRYHNVGFSVRQGSPDIHAHGKGNVGVIYGISRTAEIEVIVKHESKESIFCDNFEVVGNELFFDQVTLENSDQLIIEEIQRLISGEYRLMGRNYEYRNRHWHGNFPKYQASSGSSVPKKERFVDGYMKVKFYTHAQLIKFLEMKTTIRKAY